MDFTLSEMQEMLRTSARDFLKTNCPTKFVREMASDQKGFTDDLWKQMGEMGWMGLAVSEDFGGAGGSFLDLVILLEEMGRYCLPGPFFATVVLGGTLLSEAGNKEQKNTLLPKLAEGKLFLTLALLEDSGIISAADIKTTAEKQGDNFVLHGTKLFVADAHVADYIICAARTSEKGRPEEGVTLFLVDAKNKGIGTSQLNTLIGDKQCEVVFDNVVVPADNIIGSLNEGWQYINKVMENATIGRCAEMVGASRQLLDITLDYVKQRKAFGHPVGSFQAIQHYMANSIVDTDGCSLVVYNAAWRLSECLPAEMEVATAKSLVNEGFKRVASLCFQSHGAIGFTDDHDVPLYYKRAKAWEMTLGSTRFHRNKIGELAGF